MAMVQYPLWPNCCNECQFCLRTERIPISLDRQIKRIHNIRKNLDFVDWKDTFKDGISLLGGEIYFITNETLQNEFLLLIDDIIEKVIKPYQYTMYSTVTNGLYDPNFLFKVVDKFIDAGISTDRLDINFSYDLKYRFKSQADAQRVINNINTFHVKYNYRVGVQMILTQYLIDMILDGIFKIEEFESSVVPGNFLAFLYPHPIATGIKLSDFNFTRDSLLKVCQFLKENYPANFEAFVSSCINSSRFKYTGLIDNESGNYKQKPKLTYDKRHKNNKCGHSTLYQCYSDCDRCMLCDLLNFY